MAEILQFTPKADLDAEANLKGFIGVCRSQLTAFGSTLPFDENIWDVTDALRMKGKNSVSRLVFSTWDTVNNSSPEAMSEPFLSFAKAYMRYQHAMRPTKSVGSRIAAIRALDAALKENGALANPSGISAEVFHRAAQLVAKRFSPAVAFRVGGQLEIIANFVATHRLSILPASWRNPIRRPRDSVRVGKEFDDQRYSKLPSPNALAALAKIFHMASEPADVIVSSVAAILCSAPDRINEVLNLEVDCEVTQKIPSTGEMAYGLRWYPSKGAEPMIKWIVPSMASVVQDALRNLRRLTETARIVAKWYEDHGQKIYLPPHLEHLRERQFLSMSELSEVIFLKSVLRNMASSWCTNYKIRTHVINRKKVVAFSDVQRTILSFLPKGFPTADTERKLKFSSLLCLVQRNVLHSNRATYRCAIDRLEQGDIACRLGQRSDSGIPSIFDRFGFFEVDGSAIRINTHQFRHYLNSLAQIGGLSQLDIAKWSGRTNVAQNKVYDHQSDRDILALVRDAIGDDQKMFGSLAKTERQRLIPRYEFARLKAPTVHTTEFGYCIHDFSMLPCQIHQDCLNCDEQVCIKGDSTKEANIRIHLNETRSLLAAATEAGRDGDVGASRWVDHQKKTLSRLEQLCAILDDPNVKIGSVIQPSGVVPPSKIEQANAQRKLVGKAVNISIANSIKLARSTATVGGK